MEDLIRAIGQVELGEVFNVNLINVSFGEGFRLEQRFGEEDLESN